MYDILIVILFIGAIFDITLFFKIWNMTDNVKEMKRLYMFGNTDKRHIMKAVIMNDKDAILNLVCESYVNEVLRLNYLAMSDSKLEKAVMDIAAKHARYLQKYDIDIPDFSLYAKKERLRAPL